MNLYKHIKDIPEAGLWAFINNYTKKVWISYSDHILGSIARNVRDLNDGSHETKDLQKDNKGLKIVIIEECRDREHQLLFMEYYYNKYRNKGYTHYRKLHGLQYTPAVVVERNLLVHVYLKNKKNVKKLVGVFDNIDDANIFVSYAFKKMSVVFPVYARNELTRKAVIEQSRNI